MELNREQIEIEIAGLIKALKANNGWWENRGRGGWFNHDILEDALALIKELTEENEDLKAQCRYYAEAYHSVKADTVRKMQSEIKDRCIKGGIYPAFVARTIENVAKEMLEGEQK